MPSLRRTASSSAVRSSPYSNGAVAARGNGHRRSSGSETTNRRVLADIEWWRVTDGQRESSPDQESEDRNRGNVDNVALDLSLGAGIHITHVDAGVDHPSALPLPWIPTSAGVSNETSATALPTEQFSELSITPHTPTRRHHALESSSSSLESTPEAPEAPIEGLSLGMSDMDMGFEEASIPPLPMQRRDRFASLSPILMRSFTLADCFSLKDDETNQYADFAVSPLSSAPDFLN
ncbi:hypothetical protein GALMADRAFT_142105 [Galerina marginata CBS 339.88]|uniref:Uncharacterized protein n=1 Tax=Galerina marginata (strain CBS 339.88) TaxID=685588 RepID=A0A067SU98_GALM3|nr:hypothetical protein GALMADRAFT_142105 [Galerina marginata CBS 339.88]